MTEIAIAALSWIAINIITRLSGKLWVSKTYVSVGLCILLWVLIYIVQILANTYPMQWNQIVEFAVGSYWISQVIRNLYKKFVEIKTEKKEK